MTTAIAAGSLMAMAGAAGAADKVYTFALVPKNTNNPFFDQALAGCKKAEAELKGAVKCLYIGPGEHEEAQIVADLTATSALTSSDHCAAQQPRMPPLRPDRVPGSYREACYSARSMA